MALTRADADRLAVTDAPPRSLYQQIRRARLWLPLTIVGVVLTQQLVVAELGGPRAQFWAELLFYGLLGPAVTSATLNWIAAEVRRREGAQAELRELYHALSRSHALLGKIQRVTEQFASAADLNAVLGVAGEGLTTVTGAEGTTILLGGRGLRVTHTHGWQPGLPAALRHEALRRGEDLAEKVGERWALSFALLWGGQLEGSVHSYFSAPPGPDERESFAILSGEFSAAAEASRSRTRDLLTLFEADRSIRAEGNLEKLLEKLLTQMMQRADAAVGGVYLADEDGLLQLRAAHGVSEPPGVNRTSGRAAALSTLRPGEGFVGQSTEARVVHELSAGERRGPVLASAGSAVSLPLWSKDELLGEVVLAHPGAAHFSEANLPFLNLLAGHVSLAVRNARAYLQSEELAIAEERARIAREIHDGVAQALAFSALKLDLVARLVGSTTGENATGERTPRLEQATTELRLAQTTIRESIREVRRSIFALRPIDLERHGFTETIRRYCSDFEEQNDLSVALAVDGAPQLSAKSEAVLFRIFQESMNNAAKHAHARHVSVSVGRAGESGFIEVRDDGQGFDPVRVSDRVTSAGGLGLRQMRERVQARGGQFEATSQPGAGTRVYASVPE